MNLSLYDRYKDREKEELFKIIHESENYQPELIQVVKKIISQRRLEQELGDYIHAKNEKEWSYIEEKSAYLKELNYLKENGFYRSISPTMASIFEDKLAEKDIRFVNEQKIKGTMVGPIHASQFYFYPEDEERVDEVFVELGWAEKAEESKKPILEYKNILIIIIGILLLILYAQKCSY